MALWNAAWPSEPASRARLLLLFTVLIWGSTFTLVKAALADSTPLLFNLVRMAIATAALLAVNARHLRGVTRRQLAGGALAGLFLAGGYQFQTLGLVQTTPAKSAFLTGFVVVFVPLLTLVPGVRPAGAPRPEMKTALGAMLAFAGLVLLTTPAGTALSSFRLAGGDLLSLLCAVAFAAHLLTLSRVARQMSAGVLATLQIGFCTLVMLVTLPLEHAHAELHARLVVALLIAGLLATAAAFTIQSYAQQHLPPTQTVLLLTLEPVFAALTGMLFLHDRMGARALLGAGLILAGLLAIELLPSAHSTELPA